MISLSLIAGALAPWVFGFLGISIFFHAYHSSSGSTYFEDYKKEQFKIWNDID